MGKICLLTAYYRDKSSDHQEEIHFCLKKNLENDLIEKVILFAITEVPAEFINEKTTVINSTERFKFSHAFNYANSNLVNDIILTSNSDIFFDESLNLLKKLNFNNLLLTLTRKDYLDGKIIEKREVISKKNKHQTLPEYCHDSWVFKSPLKEFNYNILLGSTSCEHLLVHNAIQSGMKVMNGYNFINTYHVHKDNFRPLRIEYKVPKFHVIKAAKSLPWKNVSLL